MTPPETDRPRLRLRPWRLASFAGSVGLTLTAVAVVAVTVLGGSSTAQPASAAAASSPDRPDVGPWSTVTGAVNWLQADLDTALRRALAEPPARSGSGRRVVFDQSAQQVWLVRDSQRVHATYLVSGSVHDNLRPGSYHVSSRSRHAVGFDYRSTMDFMVRFAQGGTAAIGFHDIPVDGGGQALQDRDALGTPTSSGCIRQRHRDALELWRFAPVGTTVVVVA